VRAGGGAIFGIIRARIDTPLPVIMRQADNATLRLRHAVYNSGPMSRDGAPFDTTVDQRTLGTGLGVPDGLARGDEVIKASLKAALFHTAEAQTRVGRFTLIEPVGAGGMGEVYAAYDAQLDRKVALKLVRPDRLAESGDEASQRLLREAQVLARLSHPNVVQVYEAGMLGDRVFVAMEFIRGQTLRAWLATRLDVPAARRWRMVLDMFLAAGRGLEAAHAAGLVHRDFKPDNVLVGADGRVCVADFGLARPAAEAATLAYASDATTRDMTTRDMAAHDMTARDMTAREAITRDDATDPGHAQAAVRTLTDSRALVGTPGYMSPEQMLGDPSDSRSDQFSFCVALYEALYHVRPFVAQDLGELKRRVVTGAYAEPPRDSAVPSWIWKVIARGLAVEPAMRYPSMGALLAALARDPAQRRRRYLAMALILGAGGLIGGGVVFQAGLTSRTDPCALAGSAVTRVWSPAVAERVRAAFVGTNVAYAGAAWELARARIDDYAGALAAARKATCEATYVRHEQPEDLLRLKTLCLDRGERHLDALVAALGQADAGTVEHSATMVAGLPRLEACGDGEALVLGVAPPRDAALASAVRAIRDLLTRARVQHAAGHQPQALGLAEEALAASEGAAYPPVRAEALHALGVVLADGATAADITAAEERLLEAVDLAESHRDDALVNQIWLDLVRLAKRHHQDLTLAHQWVRRALATSHRLPDGDLQRSLALGHLGSLHYREGKYDLAAREQREALALAEQSGASRLALADRWQVLANALEALARNDEARQAYEEALALRRAALGDRHPHLARLYFDFGTFLRNLGETDRARALLEEALALWSDVHGPMSIDGVDAQLELVALEIDAGDLDRAEQYARLARESTALVAPGSLAQARAEIRLGQVAFRRRRFEDALAAFERGLTIQRRIPARPQTLALTLSSTAEALIALDRLDEALDAVAEAERLLAGASDVSSAFRAMPRKSRGMALLARGDRPAAIQAFEQALTLLESQPRYALEKADVQWALARALQGTRRELDPRARVLAQDAQRIYQARGQAGAAASADIARWLERGAAP
jgi:serine/threonine protein kinase/tetratricopeptide (TPR) repeat protein